MKFSSGLGRFLGEPRATGVALFFLYTAGFLLFIFRYQGDTQFAGNRFLISELLLIGNLLVPWFLTLPTIAAFPMALITLGTLGEVSLKKKAELGQPLLAMDLSAVAQAELLFRHSPILSGVVLGILPLFALWAGIRTLRAAPRWRKMACGRQLALISLMSVSLLWALILATPYQRCREIRVAFLGSDSIARFSPASSESMFGLVTTFLISISEFHLSRPPSLTREDSLKTLADLAPVLSFERKERMKRSVVVLLLESFIDPALFNLRYNRDPVPAFRRLQKRHFSSALRVPVFGGLTENTTFELFTGIATNQIPAGVMPNLSLIHKPMTSILRNLNRSGYETHGMHNYHSWAWRRKEVWPWLGFENMRFLNSMEPVPAGRVGWPSSDRGLFRAIKETVTKATRPQFIYGVSIATHGPYGFGPIPKDPIVLLDSPESLGVSKYAFNQLTDYLNKINLLDQELGELTDFLEREQVGFILFGDHHPSVTRAFASKLRLEPGAGSVQDRLRDSMYQTPLIIERRLAEKTHLPRTITAACLSASILEMLDVSLDSIQEMLNGECPSSSQKSAHFPVTAARKTNVIYDVINTGLGLEQTPGAPIATRNFTSK